MMARDLDHALGHLPVSKLNAIALAGIVLGWKDRYARNTAYSLRSRLCHFLHHAEQFGAEHRLREQLPRLKSPGARTVIASAEEFGKLLAVSTPWEQLFLYLTRHTAMRFSEACSITEKSWDREKHELTFVKKGGETLILPTTPEIERLLAIAQPADTDHPYIFRLAGRTYVPGSIRRHFANLKKRAGVNPDLIIHDMRRSALVAAYDATHDIRAVAQLAGHASIATTAWYLKHRDPAQLRLLVHELRPITEVKQ